MPISKDQIRAQIKRYKAVQGDRSPRHNTWDDLARVMLVGRLGFIGGGSPWQVNPGDLYDGTAMQARRGLANALGGLLRPDSGFFKMQAADDILANDEEVKAWLADSNERLFNAIYQPKARFRQATGECDNDVVTFGNGVVYIGERKAMDGVLFQSVHLKDAFVVFDDEGNPNGMYRPKTMTFRQAIDKFNGIEKLSPESQTKWNGANEKPYDDKLEFLYMVLPRKEGFDGALFARNMPWAAIWVEVQTEHACDERGFPEFPFVVPRWDTSAGEDYATDSPGLIALPDANTSQAMGRTILRAGQMAADPPWLVPDDGVFNPIHAVPGGTAYYSMEAAQATGRIPIGPAETGFKLPITLEMQQGVRDQIRSAFLRNVFNLPTEGPDMTAEEIRARKEEFLREIGPVFGRLESDYTAPMVEKSFRIMLRANQFLPVPDGLQGRAVRFEYESPIKRIRKQIEALAAKTAITNAAEYAKLTGDFEPLDNYDFDAYAQIDAVANNVPYSVLRPRSAVAQRRAERQQKADQQHQAEMAMNVADAAKTAGETPGLRQLLENAGNGVNGQDQAA